MSGDFYYEVCEQIVYTYTHECDGDRAMLVIAEMSGDGDMILRRVFSGIEATDLFDKLRGDK